MCEACVFHRAGDELLRMHLFIYLHADEADVERGEDFVRSANQRACR